MAHPQIPPPKDPFKTEAQPPAPAPEKKPAGPEPLPSGSILSASFNQTVTIPGVGQHMTVSVERSAGQAESNITSIQPYGPQGVIGLALRIRNKFETFVVPWSTVAMFRVKP